MRHEDSEDNRIVVNKFNEESVKDFEKKILNLTSMDSSMPIIVHIDSYGGNIDAFNSIHSIMNSVPNTIITVCRGKAMSAGAALLATGDVRFCDPSARIMLHEASGGAIGAVEDIKTDAFELVRLNLQVMTLIAERCGKTYEELKALIRANEGRDLYLTPEQAKSIGLIDFIGLPVVRPILSYSIECLPTKKKVTIEKEPRNDDNKKIKTDSIKKNKKIKRGKK